MRKGGKFMVTIRQKLVSNAQAAKITNGKYNAKKYIVVHETDNTDVGADADAHARLQFNGNTRDASWHWQVDDKEAVQSFTHDWACWATGTLKGNNEGIQVEICVNSDGDYIKALQNAASLIAQIMKDENISMQQIVQHNYFSGKNCPRKIRAGIVPWSNFLQMIVNADPLQIVKPNRNVLKYRILTGTYSIRKDAENAAKVMRTRFGWITYIEKDENMFRIKTGTFSGISDVQNAKIKIRKAALAQVIYIVAA